MLVVADDGIGMPVGLVARVFDLFVQGERALDRADGGLGIGLTLVRRLVELHGGAVSAASDGERRGSEFRVALPATDEPLAERAPPPSESPPRSVVVVEDNDDARDTLRALLESMGHRVSVAADGEDGLARALAVGPDLLLVDLGLPILDGYEVARRYRAARPRDTLLVALTGYGSAEDCARAEEAGFDLHVTKPLDHGVLVTLLDRCGA